MTWQEYEKEIHSFFEQQYPSADILYNTTITGRYSKVKRQVDILIEDYVAGNRIRIVVDGKFFSKKVDVKEVEMFIGMLADCDANKGLLISNEGFTAAAINRAHYDQIDIELDVLNFKDLHQFQALGGIVYSGGHGVILPAPFGWVLDGTRRDNMLATLYQRGYTLEEAARNREWMYVNIMSKTDELNTLEALLKLQEDHTLEDYPNSVITYHPTVKRENTTIKLRVIEIDTYPTKEYTGFVEFEEFTFFCVLFTREELKQKNLKKLEAVLLSVLPLNVTDAIDARLASQKSKKQIISTKKKPSGFK